MAHQKPPELPELICSTCEKLLSRFPVYAYEAQEGKFRFICGRCSLRTDVVMQRQIAYESSVQDVAFPCVYEGNGCNRRLRPGDLGDHELGCRYRPCVCPSLPARKCDWTGMCGELHGHYVRCHSSLTFDCHHRIRFRLENRFANNFVLRCDNEILLVHFEYEFATNTLFYSIENVLVSKFNTYDITFSDSKDDDDLEEILQKHKTFVTVEDVLDFRDIRQRNYLRFVCLKNVTVCVVDVDLARNKDILLNQASPRPNEEMFKCVECPICMEYMRPPIMMCSAGHSICQACRSKITICPTCREAFSGGRNFSLEDFTKFVAYPCKNRDQDCPASLPLNEVVMHEATCGFNLFKCPFVSGTCPWKDKFSKAAEHTKDNHRRHYLKGKPFSTGLKLGESSHGLIEYDRNVFYVRHLFDGYYYTCIAGLIGPNRDPGEYMFEFEISADGAGNPLIVKRTCWLIDQENMGKWLGNYIKLHACCFDKSNIRQIFAYVRILKKRQL